MRGWTDPGGRRRRHGRRGRRCCRPGDQARRRPRPRPSPRRPAPVTRTISVDAVGSASGRPDEATLSMGVQLDRPTAQAALGDASSAHHGLDRHAEGEGRGRRRHHRRRTSRSGPGPTTRARRSWATRASNSVSAVVHDVAKAGGVIDAVAAAAGDDLRLNGVSFSIDDTSAARRQGTAGRCGSRPRRQAAAAGPGRRAWSSGRSWPCRPSAYDLPQPIAYATSGGAADRAAPMPLQPGTQDVTAHVSVVFELHGA